MESLAIILKIMNLYAHNAHNEIAGASFFQDHAFLGEIYEGYDVDYDSIVERLIGLNRKPDLPALACVATDYVKQMKGAECFTALLELEEQVCKQIASLMSKESAGTQNLLADIADRSEQRQYKLKQRIKGA